MAIDWIATLQEQAEFAKQKQTLDMPDLTVAQLSRLYRVVEQGAQTFDRIIEEMEQHDVEDVDLTDAAETIADTWTNLSVTAANKLRTSQGLEPIRIADDTNNED